MSLPTETSHVASLAAKQAGERKNAEKGNTKWFLRESATIFPLPHWTVDDKRSVFFNNKIAFLKQQRVLIYSSDVTGSLKLRQMSLELVINHLSTSAPTLRIEITCQAPLGPSGHSDKEEGNIDWLVARERVCDVSVRCDVINEGQAFKLAKF